MKVKLILNENKENNCAVLCCCFSVKQYGSGEDINLPAVLQNLLKLCKDFTRNSVIKYLMQYLCFVASKIVSIKKVTRRNIK